MIYSNWENKKFNISWQLLPNYFLFLVFKFNSSAQEYIERLKESSTVLKKKIREEKLKTLALTEY